MALETFDEFLERMLKLGLTVEVDKPVTAAIINALPDLSGRPMLKKYIEATTLAGTKE